VSSHGGLVGLVELSDISASATGKHITLWREKAHKLLRTDLITGPEFGTVKGASREQEAEEA